MTREWNKRRKGSQMLEYGPLKTNKKQEDNGPTKPEFEEANRTKSKDVLRKPYHPC